MTPDLAPPCIPLADAASTMRERGFAVLAAADAAALAGVTVAAFDAMRESWDRLPPDTYLMDCGG